MLLERSVCTMRGRKVGFSKSSSTDSDSLLIIYYCICFVNGMEVIMQRVVMFDDLLFYKKEDIVVGL